MITKHLTMKADVNGPHHWFFSWTYFMFVCVCYKQFLLLSTQLFVYAHFYLLGLICAADFVLYFIFAADFVLYLIYAAMFL